MKAVDTLLEERSSDPKRGGQEVTSAPLRPKPRAFRADRAGGVVGSTSVGASTPWTSDRISNDRRRAAWSKICAVAMTSSAPVSARIVSRPSRTAPGEPTTDTRVMRSTCARSAGLQRPSMLSTGGGSCRGVPRTRFTNCCWSEVKSRRASASVSAANTFTPTIAYGSVERLGGLEIPAVEIEGRIQVVGREVGGEGEGEAERGGELGAEVAGAEEPEGQVQPFAGDRPHRLPGGRRAEVGLQLQQVLREGVAAAAQLATQRLGGPLVAAGSTAQSQVDPPRVERLERAELLGDHQGRVVRAA